jgi:nucleotide-binding universal stress UspA family protein
MYKKILVPLDGSKRAEAILPHVEELAQCSKAKVIFLQVIEPVYVPMGIYSSVSVGGMEESRREVLVHRAETYLAGLQGEFREKGLYAKTVVVGGPVVSTIINLAEREEADLIAMASHGHTGLSHVFYGSVAAGVLHRIDRPLLLIRAEGK